MAHKNRVNWLLWAAMLLFQVACSTVQITREASAPVKPTWISAPPQKAGMMYFVGIATEAETLEQGKEAAMKNATSQIAHLMGSKVESRFEHSLAANERGVKRKIVTADPRRESRSDEYFTETEQQKIKWKITAISQAIVRGEYVVGSYHEKLIRAEKNIRLEKYDVYVLVEIPAAKVNAEITIQRRENERKVRAAYDLYIQGKQQVERKSYAEAKRLFGQALTLLNDVGDVVVLPGKIVSSQQLVELLKEEMQKAGTRLMRVSLRVRADSAFYSSLSSALTAKGYVITNENPTFEITGEVDLTEGWGGLGSPVYHAEGNLSAVRRSDGSVIATVAVNGKGIHQNRRQAALDALNEAAENAGASLAEMLVQAANKPDQDVRELSVRPSSKQAAAIKTPDKKANMVTTEEPQTAMASPEQQITHNGEIESNPAPLMHTLSDADVVRLIPGRVKNRNGWAQDITEIFKAGNLAASPENVCSVLAVVQQESGYDPKPKDGNMRRTLDRAIKAKFGAAGALGIKTLLAAKQDSVRKISYWQRIENAKSEYAVEHVLHDYFTKFGASDIYEKFGFFTTAGSMQVSVRFAQDQTMLQGKGEWQIREFLYTRYGGMYIGTLRLLGYPVGYGKPVYRFADYNLGMYASRNAAIQQQVARLTGRRLALDGDLLRYGKNGAAVKEIGESEWAIIYLAGKYAPSLDSRSIRNDMLLEKTMAFENTATYLMVKRAYQSRYGSAPYARLPEVEIKSPKITSKMTTASFAQAVNKKYVKCLGRVSQKNM